MVLLYSQQTLLQSDGKEYILLFYKYSTVSGTLFTNSGVLKEDKCTTNRCRECFLCKVSWYIFQLTYLAWVTRQDISMVPWSLSYSLLRERSAQPKSWVFQVYFSFTSAAPPSLPRIHTHCDSTSSIKEIICAVYVLRAQQCRAVSARVG